MPDSGASAGPLGDLCNYNQLLKKGAWKGTKKKKIKKKNQTKSSKARKSVGKSSGAKPPGKRSEIRQCTRSSSVAHPCRVGYLYGDSESGGCSWSAGGAAQGRCPWLGRRQLPAPPANLRLARWGSSSVPPSLPPSLPPLPLSRRDPVEGGAIVTDIIPVLKPLQFVNKTSSMARARSLLNIYESFLQGGDYCKIRFPFALYPPVRLLG